jgi:glutathione peroxidase
MSAAFFKYRLFRKTIIASGLLLIAAAVYVIFVNLDSKNMTFRQKLLKAFYPVLMKLSSKSHVKKVEPAAAVQSPVSFYSLTDTSINGTPFGQLKGMKVMIVNTASNCGYTQQFANLEKLYRDHQKQLVILGFPANDFKQQEKGSDQEIAAFCKANYAVSFPLMTKSTVIPSTQQNKVYAWLTNASLNGWNNAAPTWNFCKYIIDEKGNLTHFFESGTDPLSKPVLEALKLP